MPREERVSVKTNEWLSYFVEEHQAELVEQLERELAGQGLVPPAGALGALVEGLDSDFEHEQFTAAPPALANLASALREQDAVKAPQALARVWSQVENLIGSYIAGEQELSGGARRLAYLRLSEFGVQVRAALAG
jgi:hypothetical protein